MIGFIIKFILAIAAIFLFVEIFQYFSYWGLGINIVILLIVAAIALLWIVMGFFLRRKEKIKLLTQIIGKKIKSNKKWKSAGWWIKQKFPRLYQFVLNRINIKKPTGWYLTLGVIIAAIFFFFFLSVVQDVLFKDPLYFADLRVIYLLRAITSENLSRFFAFFTNLAEPAVIIAGLVFAAIYFISVKNKIALKYLAATSLGGFLFSYLTKIILQRPRPIAANLIFPPDSYSLPSGHAVMSFCFYGFFAYLLFNKFKNNFLKIVTLVSFLLLAVFIGLSRAYLGVHYPNDVLAGWYLGFAILAMGVTIMEIEKKFYVKKNIPHKTNKPLFTTLAVLFCAFTVASFSQIKIIKPAVSAAETDISHFIKTASLYSEDLFGKKMEPLSFIIIGSEEKIINVFSAAGWSLAEKPNLNNFLKLSSTIAKNESYPTAPMTPSFYESKTNDLGFEKTTDLNSARQRHHTRYWRTDYKIGNADVWVATASFDQGVEIGPIIQIPVHQIDPDIDAEREFIMSDLLETGLISNYQKMGLVGEIEGVNAAGDNFTTDGKAYLIYL